MVVSVEVAVEVAVEVLGVLWREVVVSFFIFGEVVGIWG